MRARAPEITGWEGSASYFRFVEGVEISPEPVVDVLHGRTLGVIFRDVVAEPTREEIIARYLASQAKRTRGGDAPGTYLGAYHHGKSHNHYLDLADEVRLDLEKILDVPAEPLGRLRHVLGTHLATDGIELRPARHDGREACPGIFRSWYATHEFSLEPHEDRGQCEDPRQAGFEIQRVTSRHIIGLNVCLDNGAGGGLVVWNIRPDETTRKYLGVEYTGSPYTAEQMRDFDEIRLAVRPGDIYLFNAAHVHAVEPEHGTASRRVTLSAMMGFIDAKTVVSWT